MCVDQREQLSVMRSGLSRCQQVNWTAGQTAFGTTQVGDNKALLLFWKT